MAEFEDNPDGRIYGRISPEEPELVTVKQWQDWATRQIDKLNVEVMALRKKLAGYGETPVFDGPMLELKARLEKSENREVGLQKADARKGNLISELTERLETVERYVRNITENYVLKEDFNRLETMIREGGVVRRLHAVEDTTQANALMLQDAINRVGQRVTALEGYPRRVDKHEVGQTINFDSTSMSPENITTAFGGSLIAESFGTGPGPAEMSTLRDDEEVKAIITDEVATAIHESCSDMGGGFPMKDIYTEGQEPETPTQRTIRRTNLQLAEHRVRKYMEGHFSTASIEGVVARIWGR